MAVVYHEIYLPIDTESTFDYIVIKQGDAGTHRVRATLISNNRVYTIPTSGVSYYMKFRKPDNNYCLVEATVSDNTISAEVTEEMLRVSGTGRGEFMIVSGSDELKTATFHVKIVKETYTSGDVQSHSDFAPFAALLQGAGAAASNANTAAAAANAAASLAEQKAQAIPDDYSELVAEVAGKADQSNTYTKDQVDGLIEDVTVETDTTLTVSGSPADAAETGRQFGLINESLGAIIGGGAEQREIQFVYGSFINDGNAAEIGETVDLTNLTNWYSLKHAIVECQEGDEFLIDMVGATNARAWAFLTSNNVLLSRSNENETVTGKITAPQNAGKVIIQGIYRQTQTDTSTDNGTAYKVIAGAGKGAVVRFDTAQNLTDSEKYQARENIGVSISTDGLSYEAKSALLTCFEHVALWDDGYEEAYISALRNALFNVTYPGIVATYDNAYTVLVGNDVSVLKKYLTVKYYANASSSGETVSANDYTLNGTINSSNNVISASYNGYISNFSVSAVAVNNIRKIEYPNNTMLKTTLGEYTDDGRVNRHGMRRCIYMSSGIAEAGLVATTNPTTVDENGAYLIQVPSWATKVTVTITPATYQLAIIMYTYTAQGTTKTWAKQLDWKSGGIGTLSFTENSNYLMGIFYRISDTTDLTNLDADNVKIEFE